MVRDRVRPGKAEKLAELMALVEQADDEIDAEWEKFLASKGAESPGMYPNPLSDEFNELESVKALRAERDAVKEEAADCLVSAMSTIGAPRIGIDQVATDWFVSQIKEHRKVIAEKPQANKRYIEYWSQDDDALMAEANGKYVPDLAQGSDGLGRVSGMLAPATSFRGKTIGYCVDIVGDDLSGRAYNDMEPDELLEYGQELIDAATSYAKAYGLEGLLKFDDMSDHEISAVIEKSGRSEDDCWGVIRCIQGGRWCVFWAERGHGMHAWY